MKVGIDIQSLAGPLTGVGYYTLGLLEGLAAISPSDRLSPFYFSRRGEVDLPPSVYRNLSPLGKKYPGRLLSLGWKYLGFPPLNWLVPGMDLYHFTNFVARPVRRKPVISTIYDLSFKRFPEFTEPRNLKYLEKFVPSTLARSDRIIAISEFSKKEILSLYPVPENKVAVVYGGVDKIFRKPATADELLQVKYRFNLPEKYVLTVATWEPRKNLINLLKAWHSLRLEGKVGDCKLVLVGMKGWLYGEIEQKYRNMAGSRGVRATGYIPRTFLPLVYQGAECFIFPSLYEGQGLPPLEAMAGGVPVAASDTASLPEVLGDAALYFDPNQPREIAEALLTLLTKPALKEELSEKGRRQTEKYTWEKTAEDTLALYRRVCGRPSG